MLIALLARAPYDENDKRVNSNYNIICIVIFRVFIFYRGKIRSRNSDFRSLNYNIGISYREGNGMIKITTIRDKKVTSLIAVGHSEYAPHGQDIVCAGVTVVMTTVYSILGEVISDKNVEAVFEPGHIVIRIKKKGKKIDKIIAGAMMVLEIMQEQYPENIKIRGVI